ncbi:MAG: isopeptide-forming domain-containing fimbrial protein [Thermodesulfobacteriota bacterium]
MQEIESNQRAWKRVSSPLMAMAARVSTLCLLLLLTFAILPGMPSPAQAAEKFCSDYGGVLDGNVLLTPPVQVTIDQDCSFINWPQSNPLTTTINFQTNDPSIYLITFDNVWYDGNMACSNIDHKLWVVNSEEGAFKGACQDIMIPAETIAKASPGPTASVGMPFTYTLTLPSMQFPAGAPSPNELHTVILWDDLNATGVDMEFVSIDAYWSDTLAPVTLIPEDLPQVPAGVAFDPLVYSHGGPWSPTNLSYKPLPLPPSDTIPAGRQVIVEISVVLLDTGTNITGTTFTNTAKWWFGRAIDVDDDGIITYPDEFFEPLPGEWGISEPMTIADPNLTVTKTANQTALNLGIPAQFTISAQNTGGIDAWATTIVDQLPDGATAGMCPQLPADPNPLLTVNAEIFAADGTTSVSGGLLSPGIDYSATYNDTTCVLTFSMLSSRAVIGPTEQLIITYVLELDPDTTGDGQTLTNIAGATSWAGADPTGPYPYHTFTRSLTDGTPAIADHEDSYTVTTALSGYYFEKTVTNLDTGSYPATVAESGDTLRYRLRLFNVDQDINNITITDTLNPAWFDTGTGPADTSFSMNVLPGGATYTFDYATGDLSIFGAFGLPLDIAQGQEILVEFDIDVNSPLANGTTITNQATLTANVGFSALSDDPFVNGVSDPDNPLDDDPTVVTIQTPGPLAKTNGQSTATIGEQFTYTITVPSALIDVPLYDVQIHDDLSLSGADLQFVSAQVLSGGSWTLVNTGTTTHPVLIDANTGIDILPSNGPAVIEITVEMQNTLTNQDGLPFANSAWYTYNRANGDSNTQKTTAAGSGAAMTVIEPDITTITKAADNTTPTAGEVVRYSVTLTAASGANYSDVFDVVLTDILDLGLVYEGNPTVTVGGGVGADNTIGPPDTTGDGITIPQIMVWSLNATTPADIDIAEGETVTISYDVRVLDSVLANQTLANNATAQWTGLDGANGSERTGSDGIGGLNDYITPPAIVTVTTPDITATISKVRSNDTFGSADNDVRIGDLVEYTLTMSLSEGTLANLQIVDTLPQGLDFEGIVSINGDGGSAPYAAVAPFSHADITAAGVTETGNPATGPTTVTWALGNVANQPNDGLSDNFVIVYRARVLNSVFAPTDLSIPLNNTVNMSYDTATGTATQSDNDTIITALQPELTVSKSAAPAGGDTIIDAGELVTYTVDIINSGAGPAYDPVLQDIIPVGMRNGAATVTMVSTDLLVAGTGLANPTPSYNGGTGLVVWDLDSGVADTYTIPAGDTLRIVYQVQADAALGAGLTMTNEAQVTTYYSFDDDAVPTLGSVTGIREIYGSTNIASTTLYTSTPPTKALVSPAPANPVATIGQEVLYRIAVPGTVSASALHDVQITDALNSSLIYVIATEVSGNGFILNDSSVLPGQINLNIDLIPAGQQAIIEVRSRIDNTTLANAGNVFTNTASYTFAEIAGGTQIAGGSATTVTSVTVVEPLLTLGKIVVNTSNPGQPPIADNILRYTLTLTASAGANFSDAFDVSVADSLSLGLAYSGNPIVTGAGNTIAPPVIAGDGIAVAQSLNWSLAAGNGDIDVPEGTTVSISYDVVVLDGVLAGQILTNSALARWTSLDGADANERTGSGSPVENDYFTTPATTILTTPDTNTIAKAVLNETFGAVDTTVRIGDIIEYELRINLQEGISPAVSVVDSLPQGLQFAGVVSVNGNATAPYSPVAPFSHNDITAPVVAGNAATGPTTVTWNIGDITNGGDNDPTNNDFVIVYHARVLSLALPQINSTTLTNTVALSYTSVAGTSTQIANAALTVLQPLLAVTKSAVTAGGDTVIDASELITYTVDITNAGVAPAYDTLLQDIIPIGLRNGAATITMVSTTLLNTATSLPNIAPGYDPATGIATWNFDSGIADQYNIPAGDTLRVVYRVQADATLSASMTLTNQAQVKLYYSFDDDAVPSLGTVSGVRAVYGSIAVASTTLTTAGPNPLSKQNPATLTVAVGDTFTYRITVPAIPMTTALNDVRVLDDLSASAADLGFVSATRVSGSQPWTPVNTGTASNLIIEDTLNGIDIPAGEQVVIDITVVVNDSPVNVSGLLFNNTASYTYNQVNDDLATQLPGGGETTADMTIIGPDSVTVNKTGPAQINPGIAEVFTLNVHNTGTAPAWDLTITDVLPNPAPGGMCDTPPANITAQIFEADGVTAVSGVLLQGPDPDSDYNATYAPDPICTLTITMSSDAAVIPADNRLIITYEALLDPDNPQGTVLTNVAGATEWFSGNTAGAGATGEIRTYTRTLTDGTVGTLDHEDAHSISALSPLLQFQKTVVNMTTGENPATIATPGDVLRYTILLSNVSPVPLPDFAITDEVDRLNALGMFVPGSLAVVTIPAGGDASNTNPNGGSKATGLLDVRSLNLDAAGGVNDSLLIEFEVTLAPVITSGTVVLNQAQLTTIVTGTLNSDDPNTNGLDDPAVLGDEDPTPITIVSAPALEVLKTSEDLTGDPSILVAGDTLRYTITVKNIGTEDAINVLLRDQVPTNTSYVVDSTSLNGIVVTDPPPGGVSALQAGMKINAPENTTSGYMRADLDPAANNVATISFEVVVDASAIDGTVISNQGFVSGAGQGSGPFTEAPSDDPGTATVNDPTVDVVGSLPLIDAQKTVTLQVDNGTPGIVDPGDTLRYTITITNAGAIPATGVTFTDATPANTTYKDNSVQLNGMPVGQPDGGVSPLIAGIEVSTSDLTPPLPAAGAGTLTPGQTAVVIFDVLVNGGVVPTTIISNQGVVSSNEQANEPTDADGIDANGDQPTQIVVGDVQLLSITKDVSVVGGGVALAGGQLEYIVRVTNISTVPANNVVITDNLDIPVAGQVTYVAGSATLNDLAIGVNYAAPVITADYSTAYGDLQPGEVIEVRFRVQIGSAVAIGTTITNTGIVNWNSPDPASASVSLDVGGTPGTAILNGNVWHDAGLDLFFDSTEQPLENWSVELYRNSQLIATVLTNANGVYRLSGLAPNDITTDLYELRFRAPGAGPNTASLGYTDSVFTNGLQRISDIIVASGSNLQNLNMPIWPNGTVYNSVARVAVAGAELTLLNAATGTPLPIQCFDDPAQQNQITTQNGFYKFDLNFSDAACPAGSAYLIEVTPPAIGYLAPPSLIIPPASDASTVPFSVPTCPGSVADTVPATTEYCEVVASAAVPPLSVPPRTVGTIYHLHLVLSDGTVPGQSQIFNNPIPIDPKLNGAVAITKTSSLLNVTRGALVPYTITVTNVYGVPLSDISIIDHFPAGFKYVAGSARLDGKHTEPLINGRELVWDGLVLQINDKLSIQLLLVVSSGVSDGEYVNRAQVFNIITNTAASGEATATVQVIPDPNFDCTDVIGKVFDDHDLNGRQDPGDNGLAGVRVVTTRGLIATSDKNGRFHITCAAVPDQDHGSNFILKLDERSLPTGYRLTTENPRVHRATRGKMMRFNFGATIHRVVRIDISAGVFEPDASKLRLQWQPKISQLIEELKKAPSVLHLSYLADVEQEGLVRTRLNALKKEISKQWDRSDGGYLLALETEIFWRRGAPLKGRK